MTNELRQRRLDRWRSKQNVEAEVEEKWPQITEVRNPEARRGKSPHRSRSAAYKYLISD